MFKSIFFLAILIAARPVFSQNLGGQLVWSANEVNMLLKSKTKINKFSTIPHSLLFKADAGVGFAKQIQSSYVANLMGSGFGVVPAVLRPDYYNLTIGWVCKQEWKLEKVASLPIRLRLGSVDQTDFLEGKNSAYRK
jgi:hypothetical protein